MAPTPVKLALRRALRDVRYVRPVSYGRATGLVRDVYRQLERDFGMLAPPVALQSPSPPVLAASWLMLRESLVATGATSRADREVVATLVSQANSCPFCVEVHGMALDSLGHSSVASAIAAGRPVADPRSSATLSGAAHSELTAVAFAFHYLNRVVSVFLGPSPLPPSVPDSARAKAKAVLGRFLKPVEDAPPGDSLEFLRAGSRDFAWAEGNPVVEDAFSRAEAAFSALEISPVVRDVVSREMSTWDSLPPGLSRSWVDVTDDPAARLALVVAKAPYQVDDALVAAAGLGDRELIELVGWASFVAAQRCVTTSAHSED
ncbi:carboxymuconolactone decarboxylase family protein [Amycolatopsis regifaucium]|uniref:Alkylhydroperoxidase n=1 Tax=Amycolatopsis regifaucium TaxID=546365 RepID=A0A154MIG3_9PSEU|nr:carboxymuconolactone decarboxylase family protein [Amycolatopsis regifaucium]KZB84152.1 alkylhydroperoxidase [Amycolatopsis regifaucium]OKA08644.1 alkylhydroperoxidase [Amycolatopsis regifaucium]SFJ57969.1 alkylhydroperoxidase AhpD family core domain-containing protein [Amycolatopsis regifaucium]